MTISQFFFKILMATKLTLILLLLTRVNKNINFQLLALPRQMLNRVIRTYLGSMIILVTTKILTPLNLREQGLLFIYTILLKQPEILPYAKLPLILNFYLSLL